MSPTPLSAHGTLVRAGAPSNTPTVFTTIAELGDLTPPELNRKEFDSSVHNKNIDFYVVGMLRRNAVQIPINLIPTDPTHDHLTGLYKAIIDNSLDGYKFTYPDGTIYVMSGQVTSVKPQNPVDGKISATITIRMSGVMSIAGVTIGT